MKVLIATSDRQKGGIERALRDQLSLLTNLDALSLTILSPEGSFADQARQKGIEHIEVRNHHRLMMRYMPILSSIMLGQAEFDIILCHNGFMAAALRRHTKRLIGICHNDKPQQFKAVDELVCLTKRAADKAKDYGWQDEHLHIIPHYQDIITKAKVKNHKPVRVGAAGRMVAKKNLGIFIEIAALVKAAHPEIEFELAGTGELEAQIKELNEAKGQPVTMLGWTDFDSFLNRLDLFIIPSHDEPFGYVFIEAMSQGIGILSSPTNGAYHCLDEGKIAPIIDAADTQKFADKIIALAQSETELNALKTACLNRAKDPIFTKQTALETWRSALLS